MITLKKISAYLLFLSFLLLSTNELLALKRKVLFIGNSYMSYNNLPQLISEISTSKGDTLVYTAHMPGGATANMHWNNPQVHAYIQQGGWDYVVIQCQSQEPSFSPSQVQAQTYPYVKSLDSLVNATNPCAEVLYFMTWGRENGDALNCPNYPPVCTYQGMQQRLRESYLLFAQDFNSSVCPVGSVWKQCRDIDTTINLYNADGSHPSIVGSYLAACTFYSSIFRKPSTGSQYLPAGVTNSQLNTIQNLASNTVLDSMENWLQHGKQSIAKFTHNTVGLNVTFSNHSIKMLGASWDFGDGASSTQVSPNHTYAMPGSYTVCMKAINACMAFNHDTCKTITVSVGSGIIEQDGKHTPILLLGNSLHFSQTLIGSRFIIYNTFGQIVSDGNVEKSISLPMPPCSQPYVVRVHTKGAIFHFKFIW